MKSSIIIAALVAALSTGGAYAQGTIEVANQNNTNPSSTATSNGLLFFQPNAPFGPATLWQSNVSITMLGGSVGEGVGSLTPIVTILGSANFGDGDGNGQFTDYSNNGIYTIPGVPAGGTAEIELEMWTGTATSFIGSFYEINPYSYQDVVVFDNPTGGGTTTPTTLTGMPAVIFGPVPEPSTFALGGLGTAAVLLLRRRKSAEIR